ncbi:acid protease [Mytilinidion resinicola]|uniref:Acid protease n=1 Tax=Mytilinidion resinicola TaxID=574789 RepID=A0A6A6YW13_9PEZI|nr:acid protease [Mytilinidion resinicola]KAF2813132.1 acid protease [Mytilinidion resinicola]
MMAGTGVTVMLLLLSLLLSIPINAQKNNCSFAPVNLPIRLVGLPNQGFTRGAYLAMGTPRQNFSALPMADVNNTFLYHQDDKCQHTEAACMTYRGGFFEPENSPTYVNQSAPNVNLNPYFESSEKLTDGGTLAQDKLTLLDNVTISDFPFGLVNQSVNTGRLTNAAGIASIGLGRNSTILSLLKKAGTIGSKSYGFWWGQDGATAPARMNGNLVLGGYDRAKIKDMSNNHTDRLTAPGTCTQGMLITFTEIKLNFPNGSEPNLLDQFIGGYNLQACICTSCAMVMSMPLDPYFSRWVDWTEAVPVGRSVGINFFTMLYAGGEAYQGDLTFTTDAGLSIRIPNSQLVLPDLTIADDGSIATNTSVQDLMIYSLQDVNKNDMPRIGRYFFTSAYLHVNNEANTYTIWEASPTTNTDVVAVLDDDVAKECNVVQPKATPAESSASVPSSTSSPTGSPSPSSSTSNKLTAGAIAGIIVGSVAVAGLIAVLLWRGHSRRKQERADAAAQANAALDVSPPYQEAVHTTMVEMFGHEPPEVKGSVLPPQELWPGRQKYEPDVHELGA